MPQPTIVFNATTGSDTAASGAGPATAVTGAAAAHTGAVASTTITLTNSPDLSGVAVNTSALWLKTASGRQWSKITAVDNTAKTVTVEDSFTIDSVAPVDYAIGGKRATWDNADSKLVFTDCKNHWIIETETDQTLTGQITVATKAVLVRGATKSPRPVIKQTASGVVTFYGSLGNWRIEWLHFKHSGSPNKAYVYHEQSTAPFVTFFDCICGDVSGGENPLGFIIRGSHGKGRFIHCEARYCGGYGLVYDAWYGPQVYNCYVHHCTLGAAIVKPKGDLIFENSIIAHSGNSSTQGAIHFTEQNYGEAIIRGNTIYGNAGHGIELRGHRDVDIIGNVIANNGGYGISDTLGGDRFLRSEYNCIYGNTSGARTANVPAGSTDITTDPLLNDPVNGDYSPQATSPLLNAITGVGTL